MFWITKHRPRYLIHQYPLREALWSEPLQSEERATHRQSNLLLKMSSTNWPEETFQKERNSLNLPVTGISSQRHKVSPENPWKQQTEDCWLVTLLNLSSGQYDIQKDHTR